MNWEETPKAHGLSRGELVKGNDPIIRVINMSVSNVDNHDKEIMMHNLGVVKGRTRERTMGQKIGGNVIRQEEKRGVPR